MVSALLMGVVGLASDWGALTGPLCPVSWYSNGGRIASLAPSVVSIE